MSDTLQSDAQHPAAQSHTTEVQTSGQEQQPSLMSFDPGVALWTILTFVFLLLVLKKYAWGPILKALDDREKYIKDSLAEADQILLGPGSLFTSVLAAVAVPAILEGINASAAPRVYICNLRAQGHETTGFDVGMHVQALLDHGVHVDQVVCDTTGIALGSSSLPVVDVPLSRPSGLAHDPARLASVLSDLIG